LALALCGRAFNDRSCWARRGHGLFGLRKGEGNLPRSTQLHPKVFGQDTRATLFSMARVRVIILSQGGPALLREGDEAIDV